MFREETMANMLFSSLAYAGSYKVIFWPGEQIFIQHAKQSKSKYLNHPVSNLIIVSGCLEMFEHIQRSEYLRTSQALDTLDLDISIQIISRGMPAQAL